MDLPAEVRGMVRDTAEWTKTSFASIAIGQEVAVTPLQIAAMVSTVANGGIRYRPYVVQKIQDPRGGTTEIKPSGTRVMSPTTAEQVREMLEGCGHGRYGERLPARRLHRRRQDRHGTESRPGNQKVLGHQIHCVLRGFCAGRQSEARNRRRRRRTQGDSTTAQKSRRRYSSASPSRCCGANPCYPMFRTMLRTTRRLQKGQKRSPRPAVPRRERRRTKCWMPR